MREGVARGETFSDRARKNLSILDTIRRSGPISKTEISSLIGVNVVTVSNYVEELLRQKMIFEKELDVSRGGRRPVLLDLNSDAGYAVGIGINLMHTIAVLVDMRGNLISCIKSDRPLRKASDVVETILKLAKDILAQSGSYRDRIKGIGVGIAGIIDHKRETVRWPEKNGSDCSYTLITLPLRETMERECSLPVKVDNDATVACFAEQWLAQESAIENLLYMFSSAGCGIMVNGEIYRGASGCAGEMSICIADKNEYFCVDKNQLCCLERSDLDLGIVAGAKQALSSQKHSKVYELCMGSEEKLNLEVISRAVQAEDVFALQLIKNAAKKLGIKAAFLVNVFNPQMVIIGGGLEKLGMPFIDEIRRIIAEMSFAEAAGSVKIVPSRIGENAVALGAANLVVRDLYANTIKD